MSESTLLTKGFKMKKLLLLTAFIFAMGLSQAAVEPQVYVAKFHADWCPGCVKMAPAVDQLTKDYADAPVGFVKFDKTNEGTIKGSQMLAKSLGVENIYNKYSGKTGLLVVIDAETKKELAALTYKDTLDSMTQAIDMAMNGKKMTKGMMKKQEMMMKEMDK